MHFKKTRIAAGVLFNGAEWEWHAWNTRARSSFIASLSQGEQLRCISDIANHDPRSLSAISKAGGGAVPK
jgi:hypothetical protein